ncbi:hypothetical protein FGIG_05884 [Fasciola gigantica]|uniref:Uncharacterized protein n=1 Tax=Fasciola gigantica TaxID=46835 RepID=A0A504Z053_FASGI|nr:hypothetical protein FGIG_05884 [Fasciola gigantica]
MLDVADRDPGVETGVYSYILFRIFLWAAVSNLALHLIALLIAFNNLKAHSSARICLPALILVMGILSTLTVLLITSNISLNADISSGIVVAGVYKATGITFNEFHAITMGLLQTTLLFVFSISRFLPML